jgi:glyoxalase family protein
LTVNFDDRSAYHLYYGDGVGTPGSILTFFPYPDGYPGRPGSGQATVTSLAVPTGTLPYWSERFKENEVDFDRISNRGGSQAIPFRAPDGLQLELVAAADYTPGALWSGSAVPAENAISAIRSVSITVKRLEPTEAFLVSMMGFRKMDERENRHRFEIGEGGLRRTVDLIVDPDGPVGRQGHGSVHHIAFRVGSEAEQLERRVDLVERGFVVSAVMDRDYFKSIYFREPGGTLFELATDAPGFAIDEPVESLGSSLCLPKQFEPLRGQIAKALPPLKLPRK